MDSMPSITTNQANIHQNLDCVFPEDPYNTKLNLEAYLEQKKVFYLTDPEYPIPQPDPGNGTNTAKYAKYIERKSEFLGMVKLLLGPGNCSTIFDREDDIPTVWRKIELWLTANDCVSANDLRTKFTNAQYENYPPMRCFTSLIMQWSKRLGCLEGVPISDYAIVHKLLDGVPGKSATDPFHMLCSSLKRELDLGLKNEDGSMRVTPAYTVSQLILREATVAKEDSDFEASITAAQSRLSRHGLLVEPPTTAPTTAARQYPKLGGPRVPRNMATRPGQTKSEESWATFWPDGTDHYSAGSMPALFPSAKCSKRCGLTLSRPNGFLAHSESA